MMLSLKNWNVIWKPPTSSVLSIIQSLYVQAVIIIIIGKVTLFFKNILVASLFCVWKWKIIKLFMIEYHLWKILVMDFIYDC